MFTVAPIGTTKRATSGRTRSRSSALRRESGIAAAPDVENASSSASRAATRKASGLRSASSATSVR